MVPENFPLLMGLLRNANRFMDAAKVVVAGVIEMLVLCLNGMSERQNLENTAV